MVLALTKFIQQTISQQMHQTNKTIRGVTNETRYQHTKQTVYFHVPLLN